MNEATQTMLIFNEFLFRELARGIWDYFAQKYSQFKYKVLTVYFYAINLLL